MSIVIGDDKIPFIDLGDGFVIRLEYEDLTEEKYKEKARNELRESPEIIKNAVEELRSLIKGKLRLFCSLSHPKLVKSLGKQSSVRKAVFSFFQNYHIMDSNGSIKTIHSTRTA